jgi:uncharacterized protein YjbJ (UPF0337 family)
MKEDIMNEQVLKGKWKDIKGELQKTWGKITGDELEQTKGDMTSISGLVQQRYGIAKDEANNRVARIFQSFEDKTDSFKERMREDNEQKQH